MALSETARLIASLELKDLFSKGIGSAEKSLNSFDKKLSSTQSRSFRAGQQIGTGIRRSAALAVGGIGFLAANVALGVKSLEDLEQVTAQTNAVIKSTKGAAGQSAAGIRELAERFEGLNATMDDTVIQSGANVLLTFTNIRKQAFEPALKAALDLSTGMHQDLQSSVVQLGKALNDPIKGLTSLTRVGVAFTKSQKDQITALVKSGKTLEAQRIILAEINKEFGGSFLAQGNTTAAKVEKFKDAIQDLQRALATALLPVIGKVSDALSKFLSDPAVIKGMNDLGKSIAGLFSDDNLKAGAGLLQGAFKTIQTAAPVLKQSAEATFTIIKAAVDLFKSLPPEIQSLAIGGFAINKLTGGLVTNVIGGLADLVGKARGSNPGNPVWVATAGGAGGALGAAGGVAGKASVASRLTSLATKVFIVGAVAGLFAELVGALNAQSEANAKQTADLKTQTDAFVKTASTKDVVKALDAVNAELATSGKTLTLHDQALFFNIDGIRTTLEDERNKLLAALGRTPQTVGAAAATAINAGLKNAVAAFGGRSAPTTGLRNPILDRGGRELGQATGKIKDDLNAVHDILAGYNAEFRGAIQDLKRARSDLEIRKAAKTATGLAVDQRRGSVEGTKSIIAGLKSALAHTHDPKTAAILRADLAKVQRLLPGRQFAAQSLAKADKVARSNESTGRKINDLKAIERSLRDRGLPHAADRIRAKEDEVKRAAATAGRNTADAIRRKKLSFSPTIILPKPTVSIREYANGVRVVTNYGGQVLFHGSEG